MGSDLGSEQKATLSGTGKNNHGWYLGRFKAVGFTAVRSGRLPGNVKKLAFVAIDPNLFRFLVRRPLERRQTVLHA